MIETSTRAVSGTRPGKPLQSPAIEPAHPLAPPLVPYLLGIVVVLLALAWVMRLEARLPSIRVGDFNQPANGFTSTLQPAEYSAENSAILYSGNWFTQTLGTSTPASTSSSKVTTTSGSSLAFRFYGTDLSMIARVGPESGKVYVTVDGEPSSILPAGNHGSLIDFYANQAQDESILIARGLAHRDHIVQITADGTTEIAISGFSVSANTPFPWAFVLLYVSLSGALFVLVRVSMVNLCRRLGWI